MCISREEIFGTVAGVIRVQDYEEARATANETNFDLAWASRRTASSMRRTSSATDRPAGAGDVGAVLQRVGKTRSTWELGTSV